LKLTLKQRAILQWTVGAEQQSLFGMCQVFAILIENRQLVHAAWSHVTTEDTTGRTVGLFVQVLREHRIAFELAPQFRKLRSRCLQGLFILKAGLLKLALDLE
jgi:hypothetical protein